MTDAGVLADSQLATTEGLLEDFLWAPVDNHPLDVIRQGDRRSPKWVPWWRLAREGPFLAERSSAVLSSFGAGCAFLNTNI